MKRIFLSGPMSGLPLDNYPAFNDATAKLRALGYEVLNPAENQKQPTWEAYMRLALRQLTYCDMVAQLPGWELSSGASKEFVNASWLKIPCVAIDELLYPGVDIDAAHGKVA